MLLLFTRFLFSVSILDFCLHLYCGITPQLRFLIFLAPICLVLVFCPSEVFFSLRLLFHIEEITLFVVPKPRTCNGALSADSSESLTTFFHVFVCQTYFVRICISSFFHIVRKCMSSIIGLFKDPIFGVLIVVRNGLGTSIPPYHFSTSCTPVNVYTCECRMHEVCS